MKRLIFTIIIAIVAAIASAEILIATTNAVSVEAPAMYGASYHVAIDNLGDATIYARPNVSVAMTTKTNFYSGVAQITTNAYFIKANATPIAAGKSFSFPLTGKPGNSQDPVKNIVIESDSSSNLVYIGFNK